MFKNDVNALNEKKKFLHYIGKQEWPCALHAIRDNMLRTMVLDDELNENQRKEDHVLTSFSMAYERQFPAHSELLKHFHDTQKKYQTLMMRVAIGLPERWKIILMAANRKLKCH